MTELRDNPAFQPAGIGAGAPDAGAAAAAADPLQNLYRMSRTAGLGSGEYVAINNTSIAALLMGLASVLALLSPYLLLFVVAAVVLGVLALVQIRSSNGTQTGQVFAIGGILLALIFGGTTGGKMAMANAERRKNEAEIANVITVLGQRLANREHALAYDTLFSDKFREGFPQEEFVSRWERLEGGAGRVTSVGWGGRAEIEPPRGTAGPKAHVRASFNFEKVPTPTPLTVSLVRQEGEWVIETIGDIFDADAERRQRQQRTPGQSQMLGPQMGP